MIGRAAVGDRQAYTAVTGSASRRAAVGQLQIPVAARNVLMKDLRALRKQHE
jgi:hypothetical protein